MEIPRKLMPEIGAINNRIAAIMMVNRAVSKRVGEGKPRPGWSFEEFTQAIDLLPEVLENLVRQIKKVQHAQG